MYLLEIFKKDFLGFVKSGFMATLPPDFFVLVESYGFFKSVKGVDGELGPYKLSNTGIQFLEQVLGESEELKGAVFARLLQCGHKAWVYEEERELFNILYALEYLNLDVDKSYLKKAGFDFPQARLTLKGVRFVNENNKDGRQLMEIELPRLIVLKNKK